MADSSNIKCNFHNQDYKLYCKDCKDCICMECLGTDLHQMHSFCNFKVVKKDILKELQTFIADNGEHNCETADYFSDALKRKTEEFKDAELLIKTQVIDGAEEMLRHIKDSKDELLNSLEQQFYKHNEHIKIVQESLKKICSCVDNVDPDTTNEDQLVNLLVKMKRCISTCKHLLSKDEKPTFIQNLNCTLGYFTSISDDNTNAETICKSDDVIYTNKKPHNLGVTVGVQTDYNDSVIAKEQEESSSDEILDYPITISFDKKEGNIDKIIPISDQDAWVIIGRQLRKMKDRVLERKNYVMADDFVVLKDGSVIVLCNNYNFIRKLLLNGRVVPFACMNSCCPGSLFLTENSVFVNMYKDIDDVFNSPRFFSTMNSFSFDGILSSTRDLSSFNLKGTPKSAYYINGKVTSFCILGRYSAGFNTLSTIYLLSEKEKDNTSSKWADVKSFEGIFGMSPSTEFKSNGVCIDKNNTIVVSDSTYRCVYTLDENMKFKKFVLNNSDYDLKSPGAIAIYNGQLWVVDGKQILIFRYNVE